MERREGGGEREGGMEREKRGGRKRAGGRRSGGGRMEEEGGGKGDLKVFDFYVSARSWLPKE